MAALQIPPLGFPTFLSSPVAPSIGSAPSMDLLDPTATATPFTLGGGSHACVAASAQTTRGGKKLRFDASHNAGESDSTLKGAGGPTPDGPSVTEGAIAPPTPGSRRAAPRKTPKSKCRPGGGSSRAVGKSGAQCAPVVPVLSESSSGCKVNEVNALIETMPTPAAAAVAAGVGVGGAERGPTNRPQSTKLLLRSPPNIQIPSLSASASALTATAATNNNAPRRNAAFPAEDSSLTRLTPPTPHSRVPALRGLALRGRSSAKAAASGSACAADSSANDSLIDAPGSYTTDQGKRKRPRFHESQLLALEAHFAVEQELSAESKQRLSADLGVKPRQVCVWFQNRKVRQKTRERESELGDVQEAYGALRAHCRELQSDYELLKSDYQELLQQNTQLFAMMAEIEQQLEGSNVVTTMVTEDVTHHNGTSEFDQSEPTNSTCPSSEAYPSHVIGQMEGMWGSESMESTGREMGQNVQQQQHEEEEEDHEQQEQFLIPHQLPQEEKELALKLEPVNDDCHDQEAKQASQSVTLHERNHPLASLVERPPVPLAYSPPCEIKYSLPGPPAASMCSPSRFHATALEEAVGSRADDLPCYMEAMQAADFDDSQWRGDSWTGPAELPACLNGESTHWLDAGLGAHAVAAAAAAASAVGGEEEEVMCLGEFGLGHAFAPDFC